MQVTASAKIKIPLRPEIAKTVKVYTKGLQYCVDTGWEKNLTNKFKLQGKVYGLLKDMGLQSQLAIACIRQACAIVKRAKKGKSKPVIRNTSVRYSYSRSFSFKNNILSLSTIDGRVRIPFTIPECYKGYFDHWQIAESLLRIDRKGRAFFLFTFSKEVEPKALDSRLHTSVLGVDLGVYNLAVTSDGTFYSASHIRRVKRRYQYLRSKLTAKGTKSAKRLLRKRSGKERRFVANINHCVSKQIVNSFDGTKIVLENLKGMRDTYRGKCVNYWIHNWSYFELQAFIQYKAERKGIAVEKVKPNYTSKLCHRCGNLGNRIQGMISCPHCKLVDFSSDLNSARNLAHPMLGERQAAVNQPDAVCDEAEGHTAIEAEHNCKRATTKAYS